MGYEHRKLSAQQRFVNTYAIDEKTGCWLWRNSLDRLGYGTISFFKKQMKAHRFSWLVHFGEIPKQMHVLHKCDVRHCVNPQHLFLGTHQDNMRDRDAKGRGGFVFGEKHHASKLSQEKAFEIRWLAAMGHKQRDLAKKYGVVQRAIAQVIHLKTWRPECHD